MVKSTFISFSLHVLFIIIAYYGLPLSKINDPIDQPIDIVEDINIGSQTSLKLGNLDKKQPLKNKKIDSKNLTKKNIIPPPPPTPPGQKIIDKKNLELKKKKEVEKVAQLIKKKPKLKIKK